MKLIPQEQVQQTAQLVLSFLESDDAKIPGSMADGIFSGKSLLRGMLNGQLGVVQLDAAPPAPVPPPEEAAAEDPEPKSE